MPVDSLKPVEKVDPAGLSAVLTELSVNPFHF
jgi:hypothetical protein